MKEQRLIDANALKERMNSDFWSNAADLVDALEIIESAPTVETTDDVMERLPHGTDIEKWKRSDTKEEFYKATHETLGKVESGKTPIEAIKRLEESLNRK